MKHNEDGRLLWDRQVPSPSSAAVVVVVAAAAEEEEEEVAEGVMMVVVRTNFTYSGRSANRVT